MKTNHHRYELASLKDRRRSHVHARGLDLTTHKFAQDLNALIRSLVHTEVLTRLPRGPADPAKLVRCLGKMHRLAKDAVSVVHQLGKCCGHLKTGANPACPGGSRSIPVSHSQAVTFKVDVRTFATARPAPSRCPPFGLSGRNRKATANNRC